jgi:hypothetical protein
MGEIERERERERERESYLSFSYFFSRQTPRTYPPSVWDAPGGEEKKSEKENVKREWRWVGDRTIIPACTSEIK